MFIPAPGRIALRRLDPEPDPRAAQFVMPQTDKEKSTRCEVVAIPDRPHISDFGIMIPCPCSQGDTVLIGKYSGIEEKVTNAEGEPEEWMFVRFEEILGVERYPTFRAEFTTAESDEMLKTVRSWGNAAPATYTGALPSAKDLDRVAEEQKAAENTKETN